MKLVVVAVIDVLAVLVFAVVGRASHQEDDVLLGILVTAWPFLVGSVVGAVLSRVFAPRYGDLADVRSGGLVWSCALVIGMVLRAVSGRGIAMTFIVVAAVALAVLLLGWRAGYAAVRRVRSRPANQAG